MTALVENKRLLDYIEKKKTFDIKEGGAIYNEKTGVTKAGKKVLDEFAEILRKASNES